MTPTTRYARKGDVHIAYQVMGDGPTDLVLVNGLVAHMDLLWTEPRATAALRQLASFCRLIMFDKPGTGLSDPVIGAPTLEQRMADILAVMDAAGSERAVVLGFSEGGPPSALFAATHPERTEGLILISTYARTRSAPDFFPGHEGIAHAWRVLEELAGNHWGEGEFALAAAPSWASSDVHRRMAPIAERASASPGMVKAMIASLREYDVRSVLSSIRAPCLVMHARDEFVPIDIGRDLADRLGARFVELPGNDHAFFAGDWRPIIAEIETFITGERTAPPTGRALKTVLFTDIAGSTSLAARLGDERWREQLEQHDRVVRDEVARHDGNLVKSLGDGALASFATPTSAVRCARAVIDGTAEIGLAVRAGIHSGECEVIGDDLGGMAVHIGARIGSLAEPSEVLVSGTVRDLVVGSGIEFDSRGEHDLKGVPGRWPLFAVAEDRRREARAAPPAEVAASSTPGAAGTMRPVDRAAVMVARHAPGLARAGFRVARRARRSRP